MTPEQVGLLAESWNAVAGRREEIARAFYQLLFERHPGLRPLFTRTDMKAQYEKFAGMVDEIVRLRTAPRDFVKVAVLLGQRHAAYGVTRDHYAPAGAVLLEVLAAAFRSWVHAGGARGLVGGLSPHELDHVARGGAHAAATSIVVERQAHVAHRAHTPRLPPYARRTIRGGPCAAHQHGQGRRHAGSRVQHACRTRPGSESGRLRVAPGLVYLQTGSLGPTPRPVMERTIAAWKQLELNPSPTATASRSTPWTTCERRRRLSCAARPRSSCSPAAPPME